MHRAESARRLAEDRAAALGGDRSIGRGRRADDVAHDVGRIVAVVDRVHVLRTAQPREAVDDDHQHRRHRALEDQPVGPLHDVGLPRARGDERRDVAGVAVQHVEHRIARGPVGIVAGRRVDADRPRRPVAERIAPQAPALRRSRCADRRASPRSRQPIVRACTVSLRARKILLSPQRTLGPYDARASACAAPSPSTSSR